MMSKAWLFVALGLVLGTLEARAGDSRGSVVEIDGLAARAPAAWKEVPGVHAPRYKHFILPRVAGDKRDAELVIFYFGAGQGGSTQANIERWKTLFEPPRGKSVEQVTRVRKFSAGNARLTTVDLHGTYLHKARPVDPALTAERRPGHRMIGVVFESKNGPYFMRLVGPEKTVAHHHKRFDAWLRAFE